MENVVNIIYEFACFVVHCYNCSMVIILIFLLIHWNVMLLLTSSRILLI